MMGLEDWAKYEKNMIHPKLKESATDCTDGHRFQMT